MIIPPKVKKGDTIGLVSTARKNSLKELTYAITILKSWGLKVVLGRNLFEEDNQFSGTIKQRVKDIQEMIDDNNINAILCTRGGYGTVQIIDSINFSNLLKYPKWIIGYSDVTVLHSHLNTLGIVSLHASMPINFLNNTSFAINSIREIIFKNRSSIKAQYHPLNRPGEATAPIVGGNLSVLYSLIGSKSDIDTSGKILFLEDLDEYLYHIDRMIINLKRNGKFNALKGLIVGSMNDMNDNAIAFGKSAEEIISSHLKEYKFPVCFGFPAGHIKNNTAITLGPPSFLKVSKEEVVLSSPIS